MNINRQIAALFLLSTLLFTQCKKDETVVPEAKSVVPNASSQGADSTAAPRDTAATADTAGVEVPSPVTAGSTPQVEQAATIPASSGPVYDVTRALPSGYVTDGSVDYSTYLQKAISTYQNLLFPGFPIQVNDAGLIIPSNRILTFAPGSEIRLKPTSKNGYMILKIRNASNVTLNNPVIKGDRTTHLSSTGEHGSGIAVYSGSNITINNAKISDCWGDGIYVGRITGSMNTNIVIRNAYCKSNRRSGITVTAADRLLIDSAYAGYSNGVSPYSGINFEPNNNTDEIKNITVSNTTTEYNKGQGIQFGFSNLYGGGNKEISANVINHTDNGSSIGFKTSITTSKRAGSETVAGTVYLSNCSWNKNTVHPLNLYSREPQMKAIVANPRVSTSTSSSFLSATAAKSALIKGISGYIYSLSFSY